MSEAHLCPQCGKNTIYFEGVCWECSSRNERDKFLNLSEHEISALNDEIVKKLENGTKFDDVQSDFEGLLYLRGISDERIARIAFKRGIYYPYEIYYRAPSDVRDALIARLEENLSSRESDDVLCALAACGDDEVLRAFTKIEREPKPWQRYLYVTPRIYAMQGGFTFNEAGGRKSLIFDKCLAMQKTHDAADMSFKFTGQKCEKCGCEMIEMLNLKASDARFSFLGLKKDAVFRCCPSCISYVANYFCQSDENGEISVLPSDSEAEDNYYDDATLANLGNLKFSLDKHERPLHYGHFSELDLTIGGYPAWVQDAQYLNCPKCGEPMKFLAQIPIGTLAQGEGIIFVQICKHCGVTGGCFQCT